MDHNLNINGTVIAAQTGDTLVDAALSGGILIPHDCATGQCETCRVNVAWGDVDDADTAYGNTVLACQARVVGDATITFETVPEVETLRGKVESITPLCSDVAEVTVRTSEVLRYRPGQYARLSLEGFPPREYSYSAPLAADEQPDLAVFQIRRLPRGKVSSGLGTKITPGHRARLTGPFGNAYLREQQEGPIILASSGTGFAPIWSLARAVVAIRHKRQLTVITGVRSSKQLYMAPAFDWLRDHGHNDIKVTSRIPGGEKLLTGSPDEFLPVLHNETTIHVAGNPTLVANTRNLAWNAGATCYADPFTPSLGKLGWREKLRQFAKR